MQALSDMCVLLSLVRQRRLYSHTAECRRSSYTSTFRGGRAQSGRVRQSVIPSDSNQVAIICKWGRHITPALSDNVYLQNYACGYLNGRYRNSTVNYAPTK